MCEDIFKLMINVTIIFYGNICLKVNLVLKDHIAPVAPRPTPFQSQRALFALRQRDET